MFMKPEEIEPIPEETIQLARVVCSQDNMCLLLTQHRDTCKNRTEG